VREGDTPPETESESDSFTDEAPTAATEDDSTYVSDTESDDFENEGEK
jgi:hypothetical protein